MARENWGEPAKALGKRIRFGGDGPWNEVVGVAENVYADGVNRPRPRQSIPVSEYNHRFGLAAQQSFVVPSRLPFEANVSARERFFEKSPLKSTPLIPICRWPKSVL
jgi:hypothetical protein